MKLSWVQSTAIGGVTPALAAPMHLALRVKIFPPFLVVSTPNELYIFKEEEEENNDEACHNHSIKLL